MISFFRRKPNAPSAQDILRRLLSASPQPTAMAPKDSRGIYGLVDHLGDLRYIGSTSSARETFHRRIHHRHRAGSETTSHYFSRMYNTGRMWRLRNDPATKADGDTAKKLRNAFIAAHCRAVWAPLPDDADIAGLEAEVIALAPAAAIAWNRRGMDPYEEPEELVDMIIDTLDFGPAELAALDRQKARFLGLRPIAAKAAARPAPPPFPRGPFRFVALDVETANHDRGSICQVGVACVRADNSIETWATYVNPQTSAWVFTGLHGISGQTVADAPTFAEVLPLLERSLRGVTVYQHSGFDRSAIRAACAADGRAEPNWDWQDSVSVARRAWPELKGNGGHGLASLKAHLGLSFEHHDAGEDARAAAEVVLHAQGLRPAPAGAPDDADFDVIDDAHAAFSPASTARGRASAAEATPVGPKDGSLIGFATLTQGNIRNNHFYLSQVLDAFPEDCIGGPNAASAAVRTVSVCWGGAEPEVTDIDGTKKLFRKRGWVGEFFKKNHARAGDQVRIEAAGRYGCRVSIVRK